MKHLLLIVTILLSTQVMSYQNEIIPNECSTPGELLKKDYVGLVSSEKTLYFYRSGSSDIPTTFEGIDSLKVDIKRKYDLLFCKRRAYQRLVHERISVDVDEARGRGNDTFINFFNLMVPPLKRAELIAHNIVFGRTLTEQERLQISLKLSQYFIIWSNENSIPRSWNKFVELLQAAVDQILIAEVIFNEITQINMRENKEILGFMPMEDVVIREGNGNGTLESFFDFSVPAYVREKIIADNLTGVQENTAKELVTEFVSFASINGIPTNWNGVVLMLTQAFDNNILTVKEFVDASETYELQNRYALGFELHAYRNVSYLVDEEYNAIVSDTSYELDHVVSKSFSLKIDNAPLLTGEREIFEIRYDGMSAPVLVPTRDFNNYIGDFTEENDVVSFIINGTRKKINVPNSLIVNIVRNGVTINMVVTNNNLNHKFNGEAYILATFYQSKFFTDKKLGTQTFILDKENNITKINTNFKTSKPNKKAYVRYQLIRKGNQYYNENPSSQLKSYKK